MLSIFRLEKRYYPSLNNMQKKFRRNYTCFLFVSKRFLTLLPWIVYSFANFLSRSVWQRLQPGVSSRDIYGWLCSAICLFYWPGSAIQTHKNCFRNQVEWADSCFDLVIITTRQKMNSGVLPDSYWPTLSTPHFGPTLWTRPQRPPSRS